MMIKTLLSSSIMTTKSSLILENKNKTNKILIRQIIPSISNGFRKDLYIFFNIFPLFCSYLPSKKDLHLNKLEFPSPMDALCQVWLKLTHWFWGIRFF